MEKNLSENTRRSQKLSHDRPTVTVSIWQYADRRLIVDRIEYIPVPCVLRYFSQISAEGIVTMLFVVLHSPRAVYLGMGHECRQHCDAIEQDSQHEKDSFK